jgi:hypothetical protein
LVYLSHISVVISYWSPHSLIPGPAPL